MFNSYIKSGSLFLAGLGLLGSNNECFAPELTPTPIVRAIEADLLDKKIDLSNEAFSANLSEFNTDTINVITEQEVKTYLEKLDQGLEIVSELPDRALKHPTISLKIRQLVNNELTPAGPTLTKDQLLEIIYSSATEIIPDLLELIQIVPSKELQSVPGSWILNNPRAMEYLWKAGVTPDIQNTKSFLNMQMALEILNIHELRRFDNYKAIICNRYLLAEQSIKNELEKLLGKKYFESAGDLDNRPIAVVCFPTKSSDQNGSFLELNLNFSDSQSDDIDYLTSYYRVFYFECDLEADVFNGLSDVYALTKQPCSLVYLGGHGDQTHIGFGGDFNAVAIDLNDGDKLRYIASTISPNAHIVLDSCSTGSADNGKISIAEVISNSWPHANVYAPDTSTHNRLEFNPDGSFKSVYYIQAGLVHFKPDGSVTRESVVSGKLKRLDEKFYNFYYEFLGELRNNTAESMFKWGLTTLAIIAIYQAFSGIFKVCRFTQEKSVNQ